MRDHTTHHDDCGCQSAALKDRIATLEAELKSARADAQLAWVEVKDIEVTEAAANAHANALRDALAEAGLHDVSCEMTPGTCRTCTALAQTPAASLAAHDAEVLEPLHGYLVSAWMDGWASDSPATSAGAERVAREKAAEFMDDFLKKAPALAAQEVKP